MCSTRPVVTALVIASGFIALLAPAAGRAADGPTSRPVGRDGPATGPAGGGTVVEVETAPDRVPRQEGLGTKGYDPSKREEPFFLRTPPAERSVGSILDNKTGYDLAARRGKFVSWFGVVRVVRPLDAGGPEHGYELLVEHKYFDGLTDGHILALSFNGAGDFKAVVTAKAAAGGHGGGKDAGEAKEANQAREAKEAKDAGNAADDLPIRRLMLVRVYGTVDEGGGKDDPPTVRAEYVRAFPWKTFTFIDCYGKDQSNPKWRKLCKAPLDRIYDPYPTTAYYRDRLGDERPQ